MTPSITFSGENFTDFARIVPIYGQGCSYPTGYGVDGFQVNYDAQVDNGLEEKTYHLVLQSLDRQDNIMAYNGCEMAAAGAYGVDADETGEAWCFIQQNDKLDAPDADEVLQIVYDDAEQRCKAWFNQNIADLLNPMPESEDNFDDEPVADLSLIPAIIKEFKRYDDLANFTDDDIKEALIDECQNALKAHYKGDSEGYKFSPIDNEAGFDNLVAMAQQIVSDAKKEQGE